VPITHLTARWLPTDKGKPAARRTRKVYGSRTTNRVDQAAKEGANPKRRYGAVKMTALLALVGTSGWANGGTAVAKSDRAKRRRSLKEIGTLP
jgi:hypothetical protein